MKTSSQLRSPLLCHDKINNLSPKKPVVSSIGHHIDLRGGRNRGMDGNIVTGTELEQHADSHARCLLRVRTDRKANLHRLRQQSIPSPTPQPTNTPEPRCLGRDRIRFKFGVITDSGPNQDAVIQAMAGTNIFWWTSLNSTCMYMKAMRWYIASSHPQE